jgi:hypothetical protein
MSDYKTIAESNNFIVLDKYTRDWMVCETYQSEYDLEREYKRAGFLQVASNERFRGDCTGAMVHGIRKSR